MDATRHGSYKDSQCAAENISQIQRFLEPLVPAGRREYTKRPCHSNKIDEEREARGAATALRPRPAVYNVGRLTGDQVNVWGRLDRKTIFD